MPNESLFYHFSVDDVFDSLIEVTDYNIALFEHPFFNFLRSLHESYEAVIELYLFYQKNLQGRLRDLSEVSSHLKEEFRSAPWLRLGPHALDYDTPPYTQSPERQEQTFDAIYKEIDRFAGSSQRCSWLRLHYFSEIYELYSYWQSQGVDTLLLTDKPAIAYRLPPQEKYILAEKGFFKYQGLNLRRSHERMERLVAEKIIDQELHTRLANHLEKHQSLVLFSHEIDLSNINVQTITRECLSYATQLGLSSYQS